MRNTTPQAQNCKPISRNRPDAWNGFDLPSDACIIAFQRLHRAADAALGCACADPARLFPILVAAGFKRSWLDDLERTVYDVLQIHYAKGRDTCYAIADAAIAQSDTARAENYSFTLRSLFEEFPPVSSLIEYATARARHFAETIAKAGRHSQYARQILKDIAYRPEPVEALEIHHE